MMWRQVAVTLVVSTALVFAQNSRNCSTGIPGTCVSESQNCRWKRTSFMIEKTDSGGWFVKQQAQNKFGGLHSRIACSTGKDVDHCLKFSYSFSPENKKYSYVRVLLKQDNRNKTCVWDEAQPGKAEATVPFRTNATSFSVRIRTKRGPATERIVIGNIKYSDKPCSQWIEVTNTSIQLHYGTTVSVADDTSEESSNLLLQIGIGVGTLTFVMVVVALTLVWRRSRQKKRRKNARRGSPVDRVSNALQDDDAFPYAVSFASARPYSTTTSTTTTTAATIQSVAAGPSEPIYSLVNKSRKGKPSATALASPALAIPQQTEDSLTTKEDDSDPYNHLDHHHL